MRLIGSKWRVTVVLAVGATVASVAACCFGPVRASSVVTVKPSQLSVRAADRVTVRAATSDATRGDGVALGSTGPVVGVNLYAVRNYPAAQVAADGIRTLAYIRDDLHADAVDLVWNMYAPSYSSNSVVAKAADTLPASDIGMLTQIAQRDGLYVEYRPMLFVETAGNSWEGKIDPANPDVWFGSYYQANLPYLRMAQEYRINEYIIGTEMNGVSRDYQWGSLLAKSAKVFTGEISYAANDNLYFPPDTQLPTTRLTGVDMYEKLRVPPSAPLSEVVAAYQGFFAQMPASVLARTAIQETGIEARAGAYGDPPNLTLSGELDEAIQYNWFTAGCETVKRFHLRGIFFWKVDLADYPVDHPASSLSTFEGRSGAEAIAQCMSIIDG